MPGVAVNVTEVPMQKGFDEGDIDTLTGRLGLTAMVTGGAVAGLPAVQVSDEVSTQVTTSLFRGT